MKTKLLSILTLAALSGANLTAADSPKVRLSVELAHPSVLANKKMTTYLKVGLTGFDLEVSARRSPVNVALVIDKSGSMSGDKIRHARDAAKQALDRLGAGDVVSVIAFSDKVEVVAPASNLNEREAIKAAIDRITASGSTGLFAGVSKGSEELRKNKQPNQVNRIVLLSDGIANVGPASPQDLGRLGAALSKEGITVTTLGLGLGYNEDLMTELALRSDGNHAFIKDSEELATIFQREFGDILSVVAQRIDIRIRCADGVRPVRVLGREADIHGQEVTVAMNQLYAKQEKYVLLEVELPEGAADTDAPAAEVQLSYVNAVSAAGDTITSRAVARRVSDAALVTAGTNKAVLVDVAKFIGSEKEALAVKLNDEGKHEEAIKAYSAAAAWCTQQGKLLGAQELEKMGKDQVVRQQWFMQGGDSANTARKLQKGDYNLINTQNTFSGGTTIQEQGTLVPPKK